MYRTHDDPYCYPQGSVLRNRADLRVQADLDAFETVMTAQRFTEPLPAGRFGASHYRAIHRHIFQDVYDWAGRYRTVRIHRETSTFCYPEHIAAQTTALFENLRADRLLRGLPSDEFAAKAAHFIAELNAIHPFRDGNGRAQMAFLTALSDAAGHPLAIDRLDPDRFREAIVRSFGGPEEPLRRELASLVD